MWGLVAYVALMAGFVLVYRSGRSTIVGLRQLGERQGVGHHALLVALWRLTLITGVQWRGRLSQCSAYLHALLARRSRTSAQEALLSARARMEAEVFARLVSAAGELTMASTYSPEVLLSGRHVLHIPDAREKDDLADWDPWADMAAAERSEQRWGHPRP